MNSNASRIPGSVGNGRQESTYSRNEPPFSRPAEMSIAEKRARDYEERQRNPQKPTTPTSATRTNPTSPQPAKPSSTPKTIVNHEEIWGWAAAVGDFISHSVRALLAIGGIISINLIDVVMGSISISLLFGNTTISGVPPMWVFGTAFSMATTAIQIFFWTTVVKRGISVKQVLYWNSLPKDLKLFVPVALVLWSIDTLMDVAPLSLLVANSQYTGIIYWGMVVAVTILVLVICGFNEVFTSNVKKILW